MADDDSRAKGPETVDEGSSTDRIFPLIRESGNRKVLQDWIEKQDNYDLVPDSNDVLTDDYDCLIVDPASLLEQRESLLNRIGNEDIVLPVVLLVEESEERQTRRELREEYPALSNAVNSVVTMPISEHRFADQLRTLVQIRDQSREIATQQAQLRAIRDEHAGHGVIITDQDGTIEYVNKAHEQQSGYTKEELIGKNPRILQSGEHDESFYEDMWETILAGEVWHGEIINERKDGARFVVNMTIAPIRNVDGEIDRFIGVNHEITALKELETSLRKQGDQLEILNRILRHDIRNDLNVIIGWLDVLEDHVEESGEDYIDRVTQSASHIVELTEEAGDLVEGITTEGDPDLERVAISSVLEGEVEKRKEAFSRATIEFDDKLPPDTEVWANSMLESVFRNLINNAIQHNDSDDPRVEVHGKIENESVIVTVADNGPGIPDAEKQRIFIQAEKGLDSEGTGMGLFLVHSLVDTFGGEVWIEDNEPQGASFVVELPVATGDSYSSEEQQ